MKKNNAELTSTIEYHGAGKCVSILAPFFFFKFPDFNIYMILIDCFEEKEGRGEQENGEVKRQMKSIENATRMVSYYLVDI